jgi:2-dehydro-3-deoxyphosphogluconate aldolase / (4S)-4-hydroxy-2-oxoglutarate aldolase
MKSNQVVEILEKSPFVPVFYYSDLDTCLSVMQACIDGGLGVIEFTNRGAEAEQNFVKMLEYKTKNFPHVALGIGSIFNQEQTSKFIKIGADFIVSPILSKEMADECLLTDKLWIPGIGTTTELYQAINWGSKLTKMFPGDVLGPNFAKSVLGPIPNAKLMPTGGVKPDEANLTEWYKSGVKTVGMGSQLFDKKLIDTKNYAELTKRIKETVEIVKKIKK